MGNNYNIIHENIQESFKWERDNRKEEIGKKASDGRGKTAPLERWKNKSR
jgi:hypothetical protein